MKLDKNSRWYFSTQLIVVFLVTCFIAAISADAWVRHLETNYLLANYNEKNQQTATLLSRSIVAPVLQNDLAELDELTKAILQVDKTLIYLKVVDTEGVLLSQAGEKSLIKDIDSEFLQQLRVPVKQGGDHLANVFINWNTTSLHNDVNHHVNSIRWVVLLTVALLSLVLFSSLKRLVADPVNSINRKLRAISNGESTPKIKQHPLVSKEFSYLSHIANRLDKQYQEQLETQKSLATERDKAEAANVTKNEFLGVVSHELRTPINGVLGLLEILMKDKSLNIEQLDNITVAHSSADSLLSIVSNILDFSNIESGKLQIQTLELNLRQLVNEVISMVSTTADKKGLALNCQFDEAVPEYLMADPVRIRQILSNLLLNAIKFTETGTITVAVELVSKSDVAQVRIAVTDTGIGIEPEQQEELFSSFYQGDNSSTRKHGGTGLGLAINRKLVYAMGGNINVESELGKGSTFCFTLPYGIVKQADTKPKSAKTELAPLSGALLLAEDNPVNKMVAMKMLRSFGLTVVHAENGAKALDAFKNGSFDLVLMDIQMPEMDGYESTINIRQWEKDERSGHTPIVALTANVLTADRARCFEVGMDDFLAKPIKMTDLHKTLKHWLETDTVKA